MPNDDKFQRCLQQAIASTQLLASQRNLHQSALCQWIAGRFTLVDHFLEPPGNLAYENQHELWLCINNGAEQDIAIEVVRGWAGIVMQAHWADCLITGASSATSDGHLVRWAEIILQYRDRRAG